MINNIVLSKVQHRFYEIFKIKITGFIPLLLPFKKKVWGKKILDNNFYDYINLKEYYVEKIWKYKNFAYKM